MQTNAALTASIAISVVVLIALAVVKVRVLPASPLGLALLRAFLDDDGHGLLRCLLCLLLMLLLLLLQESLMEGLVVRFIHLLGLNLLDLAQLVLQLLHLLLELVDLAQDSALVGGVAPVNRSAWDRVCVVDRRDALRTW